MGRNLWKDGIGLREVGVGKHGKYGVRRAPRWGTGAELREGRWMALQPRTRAEMIGEGRLAPPRSPVTLGLGGYLALRECSWVVLSEMWAVCTGGRGPSKLRVNKPLAYRQVLDWWGPPRGVLRKCSF